MSGGWTSAVFFMASSASLFSSALHAPRPLSGDRIVFFQPVRKQLLDQITEFFFLAHQPRLHAQMGGFPDVCSELHVCWVSALGQWPGVVRPVFLSPAGPLKV